MEDDDDVLDRPTDRPRDRGLTEAGGGPQGPKIQNCEKSSNTLRGRGGGFLTSSTLKDFIK